MKSRVSEVGQLRVLTPAHTAHALRAHLARHNRRVLLLATGTLLVAAAAWLLLYLVACWLLILGSAATGATLSQIPSAFPILFAVAALCAVFYAWVDRRLTPDEQPRDDKTVGEICTDFLLALPRITLTVGGTLAAWQRLDDRDRQQAAVLLHRLADERRLPMSRVRLEIPDPASALRILFALQITQIIETYREESEFSLKLNPLRPPALRLISDNYADA